MRRVVNVWSRRIGMLGDFPRRVDDKIDATRSHWDAYRTGRTSYHRWLHRQQRNGRQIEVAVETIIERTVDLKIGGE